MNFLIEKIFGKIFKYFTNKNLYVGVSPITSTILKQFLVLFILRGIYFAKYYTRRSEGGENKKNGLWEKNGYQRRREGGGGDRGYIIV